ncbi:redox-regulated ATPase YchF [Helicobacter ailurogastricus]|uniref:Ribosome-binding ATPase YchF n=1 Tax=Helicobacter ailurogastricus TaxID=1578720 RepID=A0A0K2X6X4_9HELI|nr:redox-regulated ATPase YchF [Helicobacter ailurogastricus]GMB90929.1 Ribosome-binding ATPase YchF [Helicobacter ailurogastricus]CRF40733.1 GTP-binding and nucleic acid-binding protein YchF [Helicobacter ailurogastricus]CRF43125.1 GTP-binding and nucleic acid-binding protein YchF [Helicobacter ailurogastricus]CRF44354.1 GTP-binding and nucleic acid-binding protein YchF [Helicobacter ailurogastricus]
MGLSIGIVGLPNVGKSSLFNALTKSANAQSANYPFCTIDPNKAIVDVPDARLKALADIVKPEKIQHSSVEFVDIAGLIKGASAGEGLGNQFLAHVKECAVILHVVRCFEDEDVTHVSGEVNPLSDIETIEVELILADIQTLQKRLEKLAKLAKTSKEAQASLEIANALLAHLNELKPASSFKDREHPAFIALNQELRFLSVKKVIFVANVDEARLSGLNDHALKVQELATGRGAGFVALCAKLEEELVSMEESEALEFLQSLGAESSGLDQIIKLGFEALGLMSYFTAGVKEVRAWTIVKGSSAPTAAGVIHKDFEKGFIKAETIAYKDFIAYGGEAGAKAKGALRVEGKDYIVQDGDVMHFRFNV